MRSHNGMRPQDVVILMKILTLPDTSWQYRELSASLYLSMSEVSDSLNRSNMAGLIDESKKKVHRQSLMEFIQYGVHYVFPAVPASMVTGIATAHSYAFYKKYFISEMNYAWPDEEGDMRGLAIQPLYRNVVKAVKKDEKLYLLLASIDIIRVGRTREFKIAIEELRQSYIMSHQVNITRIKAVYDALEELADEAIFVGGATVSLYTDRPTGEIRPTDDIDVLIELLLYKDYAAIEEKLRKKGFVNDIESGVICRYIINGIAVDVMPTSEEILGFANKWYAEAFSHAIQISIGEEYTIKIFSSIYFIATKLEAYKNRGANDGRTSTDFEDIVFILNNRTSIWHELAEARGEVRQYLKAEFKELISQPYIDEWISSHVDYHEQRRVIFIIGSMREFAEN